MPRTNVDMVEGEQSKGMVKVAQTGKLGPRWKNSSLIWVGQVL